MRKIKKTYAYVPIHVLSQIDEQASNENRNIVRNLERNIYYIFR